VGGKSLRRHRRPRQSLDGHLKAAPARLIVI
jgi:hypothetical protein